LGNISHAQYTGLVREELQKFLGKKKLRQMTVEEAETFLHKIKNMPIPIDEAPRERPSNVINLMDALKKSIGADVPSAKKPPKSVREAPAKGVGLVKGQVKSGAKRKSA